MRSVLRHQGVIVAGALVLGAGLTMALPAAFQQPPIFRGGTTIVQVDAIVSDDKGGPIRDLGVNDFEVLDDGRAVAIQTLRFVGADANASPQALAPIRTADGEAREASRDDVHLYAIFLDDYHVQRMGELRAIEPIVAFAESLPPTDLVAVYYPLDSVTDPRFTRDRAMVSRAIRAFKGRMGDYTPTRPVEEEHLRYPRDIERIRRQVTSTALQGLVTHLGALTQGRKTVLFVSEGFTQPLFDLQDIYRAASRSNVAIYPIDPRGMTGDDRGTTVSQMMNASLGDRDMLRALALETGGRPIVYRNDIRGELQRIVNDAKAYYLLAYESPHPNDGTFHRVTVRVKRSHATVLARTGYWSQSADDRNSSPASALVMVSPEIQQALNRLADSLRPDADDSSVPPHVRSSDQPAPSSAAVLSAPTVSVARGQTMTVISRREFRRTDMMVVQAVTAGQPTVTASLLDRFGKRLIDLPVTTSPGTCRIELALGNLGPGDYVLQLSARLATHAAAEYVAFRVAR